MPETKEKILSVKEMRKVDAKAVSLGLPVFLMMENAGNALARSMLDGLQDLQGKKVVVYVAFQITEGVALLLQGTWHIMELMLQ